MGMVKYNSNIFVEEYTPFSIYAVCIALLWVGIFITCISVLRKKQFFYKALLNIHFICFTYNMYNQNTPSNRNAIYKSFEF